MGTADENAEALKENTGMLDNLGNLTIGQIAETGMLIGGLAGNTKIGQRISQVMAALQLATMLQRLFTGKNTLANTTLSGVITGGLIPAILANTAAQEPGKTGIYPPLGYAMEESQKVLEAAILLFFMVMKRSFLFQMEKQFRRFRRC